MIKETVKIIIKIFIPYSFTFIGSTYLEYIQFITFIKILTYTIAYIKQYGVNVKVHLFKKNV